LSAGKIQLQPKLLNLLNRGSLLGWAPRTHGCLGKRGAHKKRSKEAVHTIVASDWLQQQQDYNLLTQALWAGNANISAMAIRAIFKPYSKHGLTPRNANDDDHRKIRLKPKAGLLNIAHPS
jgi:hypothetical protein